MQPLDLQRLSFSLNYSEFKWHTPNIYHSAHSIAFIIYIYTYCTTTHENPPIIHLHNGYSIQLLKLFNNKIDIKSFRWNSIVFFFVFIYFCFVLFECSQSAWMCSMQFVMFSDARKARRVEKYGATDPSISNGCQRIHPSAI